LKYDMYRNSWPLLALATYRKLLSTRKATADAESDESFNETEGAALAGPR